MSRFRMSLIGATMLGALLGAPFSVMAQPIQGIYIGAGAGGNFLQQELALAQPGLNNVSRVSPGGAVLATTPGPNAGASRISPNVGEVGVGSLGYGFGNGLRLELEGDFRHNDIRQWSGFSQPTTASGDQYSFGGTANVLFDLDIGLNWLYPYIGAGAGIADSHFTNLRVVSPGLGYSQTSNGWSANFAYQGIVGLSFPIAPVPGFSLTAEYRFYGLLDGPSFKSSSPQNVVALGAGGARVGVVDRSTNLDINRDYNHSLLLGVRYAFNNPPPAPPPAPAVQAPAPAPARTYLVFFDWDRADLSDRARQIVGEAAQASTRVQTTRIEVEGNADRSGTPEYNQRLSLRRAQTVAAELVRDGVPNTAIAIQAFGDTRPLVPTGPGVREPQNRRVEIILR